MVENAKGQLDTAVAGFDAAKAAAEAKKTGGGNSVAAMGATTSPSGSHSEG
jgi:hypothetical protein